MFEEALDEFRNEAFEYPKVVLLRMRGSSHSPTIVESQEIDQSPTVLEVEGVSPSRITRELKGLKTNVIRPCSTIQIDLFKAGKVA